MAWSWETDDIPPEEWPECFRASQDAVCKVCGKVFGGHYQPAKETCPTLIIACDGTWLKL